MSAVEEILAERQTTHGSFADNARVAQALRALYRAQPGWAALTEIQREALDMIAGKISRIMSGQGSFEDHWIDLAGYSTLARKEAAGITGEPPQ